MPRRTIQRADSRHYNPPCLSHISMSSICHLLSAEHWICLLRFICWHPVQQGDGARRWGSEVWFGPEARALTKGSESQERSLPTLLREYKPEVSWLRSRKQPLSAGPKFASTMFLVFTACCLWVHSIVLQQLGCSETLGLKFQRPLASPLPHSGAEGCVSSVVGAVQFMAAEGVSAAKGTPLWGDAFWHNFITGKRENFDCDAAAF